MKRGLFTSLMGCAVLLFLPTGAQSPLQGEPQTRLADGLYSRGVYDLALEEYERILSGVPKVGNLEQIRFRAAESARQLKKTKTAETYYRLILKEGEPSELVQRSQYRLAELLFSQDKIGEAGALLTAVVRSRPGAPLEPAARFLLGQVLEADEKGDVAVTQYQAILQGFPHDELAGYAALRVAALGNPSVEEKRKAYQMGLEQAQNASMKVEALWGLAALETGEQQHEKAAEAYWELWTRHGNHPRVREGMIYLAWSQVQAGKFDRALKLYAETSESRRAEFPDTWVYLQAVSLQNLERTEEAAEAFENLLTRFPESRFRSIAGYEVASYYAEKGEYERVLDVADEVRSVPGREVEGLWLLAESARASGKLEQALDDYQLLIQKYPEVPLAVDAAFLRAYLLREDRPLESAQELRNVARANPDDSRSLDALWTAGDILLSEGELQQAYSSWREVVEDSEIPDPPRVWKLALLAVRLENDDDAVRLLPQVLGSGIPEAQQAEARYWLGVVLERNEEAEKAKNAYALALQTLPSASWVRNARLRLGRLHQQAGEDVQALETFLPLAGQEPSVLPDRSLLWLMDVAGQEERPQDEITLAQALQGQTPDPALKELGAYAEASALSELDKPEAAVKAWRRGLELNSETVDAAEAAIALGDTLLDLNEPESAMDAYTQGASLASTLEEGRLQAQALVGLGKAEQVRENWEAAGRHFLSVSVLFDDPELVPFCLRLAADSFDRAGQPERAQLAREELQQRYPEPSPSLSPSPLEKTP